MHTRVHGHSLRYLNPKPIFSNSRKFLNKHLFESNKSKKKKKPIQCFTYTRTYIEREINLLPIDGFRARPRLGGRRRWWTPRRRRQRPSSWSSLHFCHCCVCEKFVQRVQYFPLILVKTRVKSVIYRGFGMRKG